MMQEKNTNLKSISISVASPEDILSWSYGEVTKPETLNYRTQRPEKDGLFSERIFGPTKDYECYCGKYKKVRYKGVTCEKCGVEVTRAVVRRERMGHITLSTPVAHVWFLKTAPSKLSLFLNISVPKLEKVIYYAAFIVTNVNEEHKKRALQELDKEFKALKGGEGENDKMLKEKHSRVKEAISSLKTGLILSEAEYHILSEKFGDVFEADQGASAIRKMLERINLEELVKQLEKELSTATDSIRQKRILLRLKLAQSFLRTHMRPEWMVMTVLPILPPELRPMVALDGGNYATADLNDLYSRVINRNNRLKKLIELHAPEVILTNEKRMLQEAVDALIDNSSRAGSQLLSTKRRPLRSLADILKGKQGRFRQNLLGKRVDYSGRSVIVVGPELHLNECGLPKHMALELFRPFVIQKIIERGYAYNIKQANRLIEQETPEIWAILEEVIKNRRVLLNRAPTLHRLGIQAFNPILVEGMAIRIPPLVCSAFNADFDGDQMGVHLPLTIEAQAESNMFMDAGKNLLKPANGNPIVSPSQDMVLGVYFLTREVPGARGEGKAFSSFDEAQLAHDNGDLEMGAKVKVLHEGEVKDTTLGRLIFNSILPKEVGFINEKLDKKGLEKTVSKIIELCGIEHASQYIDAIKTMGYKYATQSAVTWSMWDTVTPKDKEKLMKESDEKVKEIEEQYEEGLLTKEERKERIVRIWMDTREKISKMLPSAFDFHNPIFMIVDSKSRGSWAQPIQMMGMKGNVNDPKGEVIELPIKSSYKEGFSVLEYFVSTHGSRKGTTDTALKTAQAGYLTRRLVDVSQDLVIREEDCGCEEGIEVFRADGDEFGYAFGDRIYSRTVLEDIVVDKKVIVKANEPITREAADAIQKSKLESIVVRSPISCKTLYGICSKCYGYDLSKNKPIRLGEAVGVIAAQSIGEPGTQLTMRTFHTGGIAGTDITHGLPRVEEIFEARPPKGKAPLARAKGVLEEIEERGLSWILKVHETETAAGEQKKRAKKVGSQMVDYFVPAGVRLLVKKGDIVEKGQQLCEGSLDLKEILAYRGIESLRRYIINEVQKVYIPAGSPINDKHIEIIVRQMLARVAIKEPGETEFMVGETVDKSYFISINRSARSEKKEIAKAVQKVFGITRVALTTESFLSAASFQETARVLVDAAVRRKKDILRGLKENVIIGKLIPVGSGLSGIPAEILEELKEKLTGKPEIDTLTLSQEN